MPHDHFRAYLPAPLRRVVVTARRLARLERLLVYAVDRSALGARQPRAELCYRVAPPGELGSLADHPDYGSASMRYLRARLAAGDRLITGHLGRQRIFTGWVAIGSVEVGRVMVPVAAPIAYCYKLYTLPAWRRRGAVEGFYAFVAHLVAEAGVGILSATVTVSNAASRGAHENLGFKKCGELLVAHAGRCSLCVATGEVVRWLGSRIVIPPRRPLAPPPR